MTTQFFLFSIVLWYLIGRVKKFIPRLKLSDLLYDVIIIVLALGGGMLLALQFKLDVFVLLAEVMKPGTTIEPTFTGQVFGGLVLASGSSGVFELLKAINGRTEPIPETPPPNEPNG